MGSSQTESCPGEPGIRGSSVLLNGFYKPDLYDLQGSAYTRRDLIVPEIA